MERHERIKPVDDTFLPPDQLAIQQRARRNALAQYEEQRAQLRQFSHLVDEWVGGHMAKAVTRRDMESRQVVGRDLYKRVAAKPGRGLEIIANARVIYENDLARREREAQQPKGRWVAESGNSNPITVQLAQATAAARRWVANTNPDAAGVLTLGR